MRHMSNFKSLKVMSMVFVGLLVALALAPQWTQARVNPAIAGPADGGEGDPLDSNDYSNGGGGSTDNDIHEQSTVIDSPDLGGRMLWTILRRGDVVFLPFFHGSIMNIQTIELPIRHSAAVEHAD